MAVQSCMEWLPVKENIRISFDNIRERLTHRKFVYSVGDLRLSTFAISKYSVMKELSLSFFSNISNSLKILINIYQQKG